MAITSLGMNATFRRFTGTAGRTLRSKNNRGHFNICFLSFHHKDILCNCIQGVITMRFSGGYIYKLKQIKEFNPSAVET